MTRDVICNITSALSYQISAVTFKLQHGSATNNQDPLPIPPNCSNYQIFQFQKTTLSTFGVTGSCAYTLPDGAVLAIAFNCPFDQMGTTGTSNCWFYAGIQPAANQNGSIYYVDCTVTIDGQPFSQNPFGPSSGSNIVANLNLNIF